MKPPRLPPEHPDRIIELEEMLDRPMAEHMEAALTAGWDVWEIDLAVRSLVEHFVKRIAANADTDRQIAEAMALIPKH